MIVSSQKREVCTCVSSLCSAEMATGVTLVVATVHKPTTHPSKLCSCTVIAEVGYVLEIEVYGTVSRGGLQKKLDDLEVCPSHQNCDCCKNPNNLWRCFCALHRKSTAGRCFDGSTREQQNLCYKRPSGARQQGNVCTTTGSTVVPKMCESISGIAQFLSCKEKVITLPAWLSSPAIMVPMVCVEG